MIDVPQSIIGESLAFISTLFDDLKVWIFLILGLVIGFWAIGKVIKTINRHFDLKEEEFYAELTEKYPTVAWSLGKLSTQDFIEIYPDEAYEELSKYGLGSTKTKAEIIEELD